jgi:hypothetical protein
MNMTPTHAKCHHCEVEFHGQHSPRSREENAMVLLRDHIRDSHPDKIVVCPREPAPGGPFMYNDATHWRADNTCSYCGSLSEDAFFAAIENGADLGTTDKDYKIYVTAPGIFHGKFYFQHLSDAGRDRFISLYNAKTLKIDGSVGGQLAVAPFFAAAVAEPAAAT